MENVYTMVTGITLFITGIVTLVFCMTITHLIKLYPLHTQIVQANKTIQATINVTKQTLDLIVKDDPNKTVFIRKFVSDLNVFAHTVNKKSPIPCPSFPEFLLKIPVINSSYNQIVEDVKTYNQVAFVYANYWEKEYKTNPLGKALIKLFPRVSVIPVKINYSVKTNQILR